MCGAPTCVSSGHLSSMLRAQGSFLPGDMEDTEPQDGNDASAMGSSSTGRDYTTQDLMQVMMVVQRDVSTILWDNATIRQELNSLRDENSSLKQHNMLLSKRLDELQKEVEALDRDSTLAMEMLDRQIDLQEQISCRNNLRFFNVTETGKERYTACVEQILDLLKHVYPERGWCRNDIERCHRIGNRQPNGGQNPRPVVVKFLHWSDKMTILTTGRAKLWEHGVKVAGD